MTLNYYFSSMYLVLLNPFFFNQANLQNIYHVTWINVIHFDLNYVDELQELYQEILHFR